MVDLKYCHSVRLDIAFFRITDFQIKLLLIAAVVYKFDLCAVHERRAGLGVCRLVERGVLCFVKRQPKHRRLVRTVVGYGLKPYGGICIPVIGGDSRCLAVAVEVILKLQSRFFNCHNRF